MGPVAANEELRRASEAPDSLRTNPVTGGHQSSKVSKKKVELLTWRSPPGAFQTSASPVPPPFIPANVAPSMTARPVLWMAPPRPGSASSPIAWQDVNPQLRTTRAPVLLMAPPTGGTGSSSSPPPALQMLKTVSTTVAAPALYRPPPLKADEKLTTEFETKSVPVL